MKNAAVEIPAAAASVSSSFQSFARMQSAKTLRCFRMTFPPKIPK